MRSDTFSSTLMASMQTAGYPNSASMSADDVKIDRDSTSKDAYTPEADAGGSGGSDSGMPAWAIALIFVAVAAAGGVFGTVVYLAATGNLGLLTGKRLAEDKAKLAGDSQQPARQPHAAGASSSSEKFIKMNL